jgi:hypothetical protein
LRSAPINFRARRLRTAWAAGIICELGKRAAVATACKSMRSGKGRKRKRPAKEVRKEQEDRSKRRTSATSAGGFGGFLLPSALGAIKDRTGTFALGFAVLVFVGAGRARAPCLASAAFGARSGMPSPHAEPGYIPAAKNSRAAQRRSNRFQRLCHVRPGRWEQNIIRHTLMVIRISSL